jgi:hypothetical protein
MFPLPSLLLGTVLILPAPGGSAITLGPQGPTYTFRGEGGTSIILPPDGGPIYDFDQGGGSHITLVPDEAPIYTFGSGDDE